MLFLEDIRDAPKPQWIRHTFVGSLKDGKDLDPDDRMLYFRLLRDLTYSLLHTDYEYDTIDDWVR